MTKSATAFGLLLIFSGQSFAAEFAISGLGATTCAEITQMHPAFVATPEGAAILSWSQGYMSGINFDRIANELHNGAQGQAIKNLNGTTPEGELAFIANFCERNQLKPLHAAVEALFIALPDAAKSPKN